MISKRVRDFAGWLPALGGRQRAAIGGILLGNARSIDDDLLPAWHIPHERAGHRQPDQ
jgi:hypothetical protein